MFFQFINGERCKRFKDAILKDTTCDQIHMKRDKSE